MKWHRTLAQNDRCSMARPPKPWYRNDRQEWFVTIDKILHRLGPDKDAALQKYHLLMSKPKDKPVSRDAVVLPLDAFLDYVQNHNTPKTFRYYHDFAQSFCKSIPKTLTTGQLRPYHVQTWVDSHKNLVPIHQTWGNCYDQTCDALGRKARIHRRFAHCLHGEARTWPPRKDGFR